MKNKVSNTWQPSVLFPLASVDNITANSIFSKCVFSEMVYQYTLTITRVRIYNNNDFKYSLIDAGDVQTSSDELN